MINSRIYLRVLILSLLVCAFTNGAMVWADPSAPNTAVEPTVATDAAAVPESNPGRAEKSVTFYTGYGYEAGHFWHIPFKLWVSERSDAFRRLAGKGARKVIRDKAGLEELSDAQRGRYEKVVENFIADSESREVVAIMFANDPRDEIFMLANSKGDNKTDRNGNLQGTISLSRERADELLSAQVSEHGWLSFKVVSENQAGAGHVRLIAPTGMSVISDIDDTIKDTGITKGHDVVLKNTFFEPFKQVSCMAELYSSFDDQVAFHYVSGAPWQLYAPLINFMFDGPDAFPFGSLHMKNVRTNLTERSSYNDFWKLLSQGSRQTTYEQKLKQITQLITHFPGKQFVLIGDSGERDPEVFAEIRRRFPAHIERIVIRDLDNLSKHDKERYRDMSIIAGDTNATSGCPARDSLLP